MKKWPFLKGAQITHKKFLWGMIGVAAGILLYLYVIIPLAEAAKKAEDEIALHQKILTKYSEILQTRKTAEENLERALKQNEEVQKKLLPGETPQLAGAHLQDVVKKLSDKYGLSLRSFRILEPKDLGLYRRISLQIDFNPLSSMTHLTQFIYELENQDKEIFISDMDLLIFNPRMPSNIQGNMVISGLMKGEKPKEKGKGK
jgi:Type II secretion system (T2SS), protein M subtype b